MTYARNTYKNKTTSRQCETCAFASVTTPTPHFSDMSGDKTVIRCHLHPPILNDSSQYFFPRMERGHGCMEWRADDGAARDVNGTPLHLRCDTCEFSRRNGHQCGLKPPAAISHEGYAILPSVGPNQWCGDHQLEEGVGCDVFTGIIPGFLQDLIEKAKKAA